MVRPAGRRPLVDHLRNHYRTSEWRACRVLRIGRGTYRYQSHQEPWTELRLRLREIAQSWVRYGYRKILVLLRREGWQVGKYLVYRLYREEGLLLKKRPQRNATAPNQAWSLDFVADQLQDGRRFRCLTIIDGIPTAERLSDMLNKAGFALLVMTGEDKHDNGTTHARENVVHETGLSQGRLGFRKSITIRESHATEFSNIVGLTQISSAKGQIHQAFPKIVETLNWAKAIAKC